MGVEENSQTAHPSTEWIQERTDWIKNREIANKAIRDYLNSRDKDIPDQNDVNIKEHAAKVLTEEEFEELRQQFRFGGKQSLNFFVITGISDKIGELPSELTQEFPTADEVQDQKGAPFLVETRMFNDRLYIVCGEYVSQKWTDLETGHPRRQLKPKECVAAISGETDLVHVRTADVPMARSICETIADSVGIQTDKEDIFYKPSFDESFVEELGDRIEKYVNMTVRVKEDADRATGSIKFTSTKDESDEYLDLRDDDEVQEELEEGSIKRGYVVLSESDFAFEMNRKQSKIWFRSYEREERIIAMANMIDNVLKQSGGYPQRKLQGFENVPE